MPNSPERQPNLAYIDDPGIALDQHLFYPGRIQEFNPDFYWQNYRWFKEFDKLWKAVKIGSERFTHDVCYPVLDKNPSDVVRLMEGLKASKPIEKILFPSPAYASEKSNDPCPHVAISGTHTTDYFIQEGAKLDGIDPEEIGMIIFDNHIDIDDSKPDTPRDISKLCKANVLRQQLESGVGSATVLGLDPLFYLNIVKGKNPGLNGEGEIDLYDDLKFHFEESQKGYRESLTFAASIAKTIRIFEAYHHFRNQNRVDILPAMNDKGYLSDPKKTGRQIAEKIKELKTQGIHYIWISFDLDSLNLSDGLTATPYTPWCISLYYGLRDIGYEFFGSRVTPTDFGKEVSDLTNRIHGYTARENLKKYDFKNPKLNETITLLQNTSSMFYPETDLLGGGVDKDMLLHRGLGGLMVNQATRLISDIKQEVDNQGLIFGLPSRYGHLKGTIVEASGLDYQGKTADAAKSIANAMLS